MKKFAALLFVIAILASIAAVSFAETAAGPKSVEIEEYSDFFPYSLAASSLTAEYGVSDDAIALEDAGEDISEYATRRIMVRTEGELHDWDGAVRVLHYEDEYILQFETEEQTRKAYARLKADGEYQGVYLDLVVQQDPLIEADDDFYASSFNGNQAHYSWGVGQMGLDDMENRLNAAGYGQADGNPAVVVAVVDTGVSNNRYINGRLLTGYNYVAQNNNTGDDEGHGTHVAGTICDGTPQRVKILPVKVLGANGKGTVLNIRNGIEYAISQGADVINMSLGAENIGQTADYFDSSLQKAYQRGITVVVAAGNSSMDTQYAYPANNPHVLTIAALDESMSLAEYSNYGDDVDFALPGSNIQSCVPTGIEAMNGTSMAAPHAAAAAASLKCWNPDLDPDTMKNILIDYSVDLGDSYLYGNGWINFKRFYLVSYNANGGSGGPYFQLKNPGTNMTLSTAAPTRSSETEIGAYTVTLNTNGGSVSQSALKADRTTAYTFRNWNTKADGTGRSWSAGESYTADADLALWAQWDSSTTGAPVTLPEATRENSSTGSYTITLDANGGTVSQSALEADRTTAYTFRNWNTKADGTGTSWSAGESCTADKDMTLWAQWDSSTSTASVTLPEPSRESSSTETYTITLDANGGTVSQSAVTADRMTNYTFLNWNTQADGSGVSYGVNASFTADDNTTLYAQWGTDSSTETVVLPAPEHRYGYTFAGWSTDASAAAGITGQYTPTEDVTFYAVWKEYYLGSGTWGDLDWKLYEDGKLVISGNGDMQAFRSTRKDAWKAYDSRITSVIIQEGITSISACAFEDCMLQRITIPDTVTSIQYGAFLGCKRLSEVTIPDSVTFIGGDAFCVCESLGSITIPDSITSIEEGTFSCCYSLWYAGIPDSVHSIGNDAFSFCKILSSITIPESVTSIGEGAFMGCTDLYRITIPADVTTIGAYTFQFCDNLSSITIPDSVVSIGKDAFAYINRLSEVNYEGTESQWNEIDVGTGNEALSNAVIRYNPKIRYTVSYNANGGSGAPDNQTKIQGRDLKLSAVRPTREGYTFAGWAEGNTASAAQYLPGGLYTRDQSATLYAVWEAVPDLVLPSALTVIEEEAFAGGAFTYVRLSENTVSIGKNAFADCPKLACIYIPEATTDIDPAAFGELSALTIFGKTGSVAETFASTHGFAFIAES